MSVFASVFMDDEVSLKVQDSDPTHVGRNIVTLDRLAKKTLNITSGDIVEIIGSKKTAAVVWPARAEDEGKGIVRMDNFIRHNAGVSLGDSVSIKKSDFKDAKEVTLAPTQEVRIIASGYNRVLKKSFLGRPLTKGDSVWISVFGSGFVYKVVTTKPAGIVKVTDFTQFTLKEKPVKEVEGVSAIAYEDIGGMKDQVLKVRELVELPMKHPELFRKLGIAPPKGILLHGPPGTGKCISGSSKVILADGRILTAKEIFSIAEKSGKIIHANDSETIIEVNDLWVPSLNTQSLKMEFSKALFVYREKYAGKLFKIKTKSGREIEVTPEHPLFVIENGFKKKKAMDLEPGAHIAVPRKLNIIPSEKIFYSEEVLKNMVVEQAICVAKPSANTRVQNLGNFMYPKEIKNVTEVTPQLSEFLAYTLAEGSFLPERNHISFCNSSPLHLQRYLYLTENLFGLKRVIEKDTSPGVFKIQIKNKTLALFLDKVIGLSKKENYSVPDIILKAPNETVRMFLRRYTESEGSVSLKQTEIEISTKSKAMANDLSYLFLRFGIVTRIRKKMLKGECYFRVMISGLDDIKKFVKEIGLDDEKKLKRTNDLISQIDKANTNVDLIPNIQSLLKNNRLELNQAIRNFYFDPKSRDYRYETGERTISRHKLQALVQKHNRFISPELRDLAFSDVFWDKIVSIEEIDCPQEDEFVYDLTVETTHNFAAGFGGVIAHNTLLAKAVANETNAHFISVTAPAIMSKFVGEAEERVRQIFKEAEENNPSIIFIDEIDAIAPKRDEVVGEVERRVVAQLLASMDGLEARGNIIVIAATNRVNSLDEALRRPGRFDREIEFGVPDRKERLEILQIHTRGMPLAGNVDLDYWASITHGFVGADLEALAKEAAMKALRRYLPKINLEEEVIPPEVLESLEVIRRDFQEAFKDVQPSALREVTVRIPRVKWNEIGGLENVKKELRQAIEWPLKFPESFTKMGIAPPKGILLYGPPGVGKTLLAKAVATESDANFISIKGPELLSMFVGESERGVRKIFRKARQVAPVIIFFDEIDSIAGSRGAGFDSGVGNRVLDQLLTELDGLETLKNVVFIAATNRPDLIDSALLRPGRIDKLIFIPAPDLETRKEILKVHTRDVPMAKDVLLDELAEKTEGFSGADLEGLVRESALMSLEDSDMKPGIVSKKHFARAFARIMGSVSKKSEKAYSEFPEKAKEYRPSYVG